jgi:predicted DNA-binding transcriptional regulator AlpA
MRERVARAGGDPTIVPDEQFKLLRLPAVVDRVGLSRATIYREIKKGNFPRPLVIGGGGP